MDCKNPNSSVYIRPIEHTADVGIYVEAPTKELAVEACVCALLNLICDTNRVSEDESVEIAIEDTLDYESLLFDLLNEVIYLMDAKKMLFSRFEIEEFDHSFKARLYGEKYDPKKHEIKEQVKAATYHQISFQKLEDKWIVQAIFDV